MKVPPRGFVSRGSRWIAARIGRCQLRQLTLGSTGRSSSARFAELCGRPHGIAVSSGTAALEIILRSLGVEGKDVLVPANTFFATAAAVVHAGGRPVSSTSSPSPSRSLRTTPSARITREHGGIVAVHIGGTVAAGIEALEDLAAAQGALAGRGRGARARIAARRSAAGSFGTAASFSFYPTKVMTSAEGGMIATDDDALAEEARIYRDQGKASFTQNSHVRMGYNWRLSEPHAIIGLRHLERLPAMIAERQRIAAYYDRGARARRRTWCRSAPAGRLCELLQVRRHAAPRTGPQGAQGRAAQPPRGRPRGRSVRGTASRAAGLRALADGRTPRVGGPLRAADVPAHLLRNGGRGAEPS